MKETKLGEFEEVLLLLVGILHEEAYAFRLAEEFENQTGRSISIGAIHSTLSRLEKKGFLESEMSAPSPTRGGRRKRVYSITALGDRVLAESKAFKQSLWDQYPPLSTGNLGFNI